MAATALAWFSMAAAAQDTLNVQPDNQPAPIEIPLALTSDIDSLLSLYHAKAYLQQDANCETSGTNPYFDKAVYVERIAKMPTIMEMVYNEPVRKMIDQYAERGRRQVALWLGLSNFYIPIFEQALESYQLPLELKYLPLIESGLNPKAESHAGASGPWQFMLNTAKHYGLQVNSLIDERKDPIRSSYAAAQFLRDLYKIFGDWNLVIAAYNCGPENINKAIKRAGGSRDYWQIYPYLPTETRGYVPAFIAANYIMTYYCEHNICPMLTDLSLKTDTIVVNRNLHLQQIADVCQTDINLLRTLNPQYRKDIVNGATEPYAVRLPIDIINRFIEYQDSVYQYKADELVGRRTEVEPAVASSTTSSSVSRSSSRSKGNGQSSSSWRRGKSYHHGSGHSSRHHRRGRR